MWRVLKSFDPTRPNFAPYGFTCEVWKPVPMKRADRHNEIELNLLKHGSLVYLLGGKKVAIPAGQLAIFWAAIPHQIVGSTTKEEYFVATIPLAWFLQCQFPEAFVKSVMHGQVLTDPEPWPRGLDFEMFGRCVQEIEKEDAYSNRLVLLEIEARLLRMALAVCREMQNEQTTVSRYSPIPVAALTHVERMTSYIAEHYTEQVRVDQIARSVGLHPNYAMALFKKALGISMVECLTQHRVAHAQRLLATTDMKIIDIAMSSGFPSPSRFYEAFERICGCSPKEYRQRHALVG